MNLLLSRFNRAKEQFRWLNYEICSDIEELCNGKIVVEVLWTDFLNWLNLANTTVPILPLDKRKVEYLIHTLAEYVDTNKDLLQYIDIDYSVKWKKLTEQERVQKMSTLDAEQKHKALKETWEKKVIESAGIDYAHHTKHRNECRQVYFHNNYRSQSKSTVRFIENLDEILSKHEKFNPKV